MPGIIGHIGGCDRFKIGIVHPYLDIAARQGDPQFIGRARHRIGCNSTRLIGGFQPKLYCSLRRRECVEIFCNSKGEAGIVAIRSHTGHLKNFRRRNDRRILNRGDNDIKTGIGRNRPVIHRQADRNQTIGIVFWRISQGRQGRIDLCGRAGNGHRG